MLIKTRVLDRDGRIYRVGGYVGYRDDIAFRVPIVVVEEDLTGAVINFSRLIHLPGSERAYVGHGRECHDDEGASNDEKPEPEERENGRKNRVPPRGALTESHTPYGITLFTVFRSLRVPHPRALLRRGSRRAVHHPSYGYM